LFGAAAALPLLMGGGDASAALTVAERDELYRKAKEEETKSFDSTKLPDENAAKLFREAQRAQQSGDVPKAIKLTNHLIEEYPGFAYGWSNRGNLFVASQEYDKAVLDYSKAIELAPSGKETWVILLNRGTTLALLNKDKEGIADFTEALKLPSTMGPAQEQILKVNRALIEMKAKDWKGALQDLEDSFKISPKQPDKWWLQYALLKYEMGQDDEAWKLLNEVNKKLPPASDVKAALSALSTERGDRDAAETFWADVQRTKSFSSKEFLEREKRWPPRAVEALKKFRGSKFTS